MSVKIGGKVLGAKEQPNTEKAKPAPKAKKRKYVTRRAYPPHVFERLFEYVAAGEDLTTACKHPNMPTPWTVRRRMQVDEVLAEQFKAAYRIHVHGAVDRLLRLPREALEGKGEPTRAEKLQAAKLESDNIKWTAAKLLTEYQGLEDGGGTVTLNIINSPDAPAGTAAPYVPPGQPVLKIVGQGDA